VLRFTVLPALEKLTANAQRTHCSLLVDAVTQDSALSTQD
jgi:hypothetical protein